MLQILLLMPVNIRMFFFCPSSTVFMAFIVDPVVTKSSKRMTLFSGGENSKSNTALTRCFDLQEATSS